MKKLSKVQTIALVVIGVIILIGFSLVNLTQMRKTSKNPGADVVAKMPDPAAGIRKEYKDKKAKKKENEGTPAQATPTLSGDDVTPVSKLTPPPPNKDKFVSADQRGEVSGVVPQGSILTEVPIEAPPTPKITAPKDDTGRKVIETPQTRLNTSGITPGIPQGLLSQTPPEEAQTSGKPLIPANIKVKPGRYLFNNLTDDALRSPAIKFQSGGPSFNLDKFSPQGEMIDVVLMHNAASNNSAIPVTAAVWTPFYFQGHRILNTGDKLLGKAEKLPRSRLGVSFDKVLFKSGKSISINAIALDIDGTLGIEGYTVGDELVQNLGIIAGEVVGEFLSKMGQNVQDQTQNGSYYGGAGGYGNGNQYNVSYDLKGALGNAIQKATSKIQEAMKSEMADNKPYVLVPAGTRARAFLLTPFDCSNADYGK